MSHTDTDSYTEMTVLWGATSSEAVLALALWGMGIPSVCSIRRGFDILSLATHPGHANWLIKSNTTLRMPLKPSATHLTHT